MKQTKGVKMKIKENSRVAIDYEVIVDGRVCDKKDAYELYMEDDTVIKNIRDSLIGSELDDNISVEIKGDSSGLEENKDAYITLGKEAFEGEIVVGDYYESKLGDGNSIGIQVVANEEDVVTGSGNHPLIGQDFMVKMHVVGIEQRETI